MTVKHLVMWNVKAENEAQRRAACHQIKRAFEGLRGKIPGMAHIEIGIDSSRIGYACDVALYSVFQDQASLEAYASHPEHLRVKRELGDTRIARHQVDYAEERE